MILNGDGQNADLEAFNPLIHKSMGDYFHFLWKVKEKDAEDSAP